MARRPRTEASSDTTPETSGVGVRRVIRVLKNKVHAGGQRRSAGDVVEGLPDDEIDALLSREFAIEVDGTNVIEAKKRGKEVIAEAAQKGQKRAAERTMMVYDELPKELRDLVQALDNQTVTDEIIQCHLEGVPTDEILRAYSK